MKLRQTIAPVAPPVTLAEMKAHLYILHDRDDLMITSMIFQATQSAEIDMNRQIMPATYELYFDALSTEMVLPRPPFISLESFQIFDGEAWNDVDPLDYLLDDKGEPAALYMRNFPGEISSDRNSVKVVYKAGWEDATKVPEPIKAWIKIQVSTFYEHRDEFVLNATVNKLPHVDGLIQRYRIHNV